MNQKSLAVATVLGALIIAGALVYHGRQLAKVSRRLQAVEQSNTALDHRLQQFSTELPVIVGQAGHDAGRQVVHGIMDELVQLPLNWVKPKPAHHASSDSKETACESPAGDPAPDTGVPAIQFNIPNPVVTFNTDIKIEVQPEFKETLANTNQAGNAELNPKPAKTR